MGYILNGSVLEETADYMNFFSGSPYTPKKNDPSYFLWKLRNNPFFKGYIYLERHNGMPVGLTTLTPKKIVSFGKHVLAAELGEALTHPDYRRKGIFSKTLAACTEYAISIGCEVIYATPNRFSLAGAKKLDYQDYPFAYIVQMHKFMFGMRQLYGYFKPQIEGRRQALLNLCESIQKQVSSRRKYTPELSRDIEIRKIDAIDTDLEGLWGTPRSDFGFFTHRDRKYLNWRFFHNPDDYHFFTAISHSRTIGYIVAKISIDRGLKIGTLCDFVTFRDTPEVFYILLRYAESFLKKKGVRHIQVWCFGNSPYCSFLTASGYTMGPERPVIIYSKTKTGKQILNSKAAWHFTVADCDHI